LQLLCTSVADADVIRDLTEIKSANQTGGGVARIDRSFVPISFSLALHENGPVLAIHQQHKNVFSWPPLYKRVFTGGFWNIISPILAE